jgi:uncharacterized membrane protein (DUF2068 family)
MAKATDLDGPGTSADAPAPAMAHDRRLPSERDRQPSSKRDRLLPWIAAERGIRALALLALGIVLLTHPDTNWATEIKHLARSWGLDPSGNVVRKILDTVRRIPAKDNVVFGVIAIAYGALEGAESYGLARRRRWGEWLTLVATSVLLAPEVWELARKVTPLKIGALVVNLLVVAYLYWRLRRRR